jgi:uncharacterized protein (DUF1501 family)
MLTVQDGSYSRRQFLRIGSLGLGGLSLSSLFAARAAAADTDRLLTGKSVIFLFQQGGPSQFETFDPKMEAPVEIRTVTGSVPTSLPGVQFGDTMQQTARLADRLNIVRCFQTNNGGHNIQPIVSADTLNANIGSLYSRVAGSTRPGTGMPSNAVLFPSAVSSEIPKGQARGDIAATGTLGAGYAPFIPGAGGELQKNMRLNLPIDRLEDRRALLGQLDRINRQIESSDQLKDVDRFQEQAYQVLLSGGVADALDLTREDPQTVARYDTSRYARPDGWSKAARGKKGYYTGHARSLGKLLLLARRLCEAGCGFVTIHAGYEGVWDMHADGNNLNMKDGMEAVGRSFDHAVAAFVQDLEARGLQDKILLVATGEMGRTPKINKNGGRDHWARLAPLLIYGGGTGGGKVIGQSTRDGGEPAGDNLTPKHLVSTILHTVFDVGQLRLQPGFGPIARLGEVAPIPGLF